MIFLSMILLCYTIHPFSKIDLKSMLATEDILRYDRIIKFKENTVVKLI